jgi:hypothetical protein
MIISIRENLTGDDLTQTLVMPYQLKTNYHPTLQWTTVDIPDIDINVGGTYYIVVRFNDTGSLGVWTYAGLGYHHDPEYTDDAYLDGKTYYSFNRGLSWTEITGIQDFCFVTYGTEV